VVDETMRAQMGSAAVLAGKAIDYVGAGTVEFIVAPTGEFFFLEVNTRIQVEHPVTELVTGLDLVRLQLLVAQGDALPPEAIDPPITGWAIEARLYAEDPAHDFLPSAGPLHRFDLPEGPGIRIDSGFEAGSVVSTNYDPMLAKVIAYAPTRTEAARLLASVLERSRVHGVVTNRDLLVGILGEAEFLAGQIDTHYLDRHAPAELMSGAMDESLAPLAALAAALAAQAARRDAVRVLGRSPSGWRNVASQLQTVSYADGDDVLTVGYRLGRDAAFEVGGERIEGVNVLAASGSEVVLAVGGVRRVFEVNQVDDAVYVETFGYRVVLHEVPRFPDLDSHVAAGSLLAPMPGTVVRVECAVGDAVGAGQVLVVIEAMKMEHRIVAPVDGVVSEVDVIDGQAVDGGQVLVVLAEEETDSE
jgi:acetyl/propionyl-CoA carboxylase alpha subunit